MQAAWPTSAQLTTYLAGMSVTIPSGIDATITLAQAVAEWEDVTGWRPFLADALNTKRYYDSADGALLDLRGGFVSVAEVRASSSGSGAGSLLVEGTDYWLWPEDSASRRRPYWGLKFRDAQRGWPQRGWAQSITVEGRRGFWDTIEEDAWMAVLKRASAVVMRYNAGATGAITKIKQGPVELTLAEGSSGAALLEADFGEIASRYQRFGG